MKQVKLQGSDRNSCRGFFPLLKTTYGYTLCLCMCILVTTTGFTHLLNIFCKVTNKGKVAIPISVSCELFEKFYYCLLHPHNHHSHGPGFFLQVKVKCVRSWRYFSLFRSTISLALPCVIRCGWCVTWRKASLDARRGRMEFV